MSKYLIIGNGFIGKRFAGFLEDAVVADGRIGSVDDVLPQLMQRYVGR